MLVIQENILKAGCSAFQFRL